VLRLAILQELLPKRIQE